MTDQSAGAGRQILVVSDDEALGHAIQFRLELEGFAVSSGDAALAAVVLGQMPVDACLVLDHRPPAFDALQVMAGHRLAGDRRPFVVLATHPTAAFRSEVEAQGARLVEKPLLNDSLLKAVVAAVGLPPV